MDNDNHEKEQLKKNLDRAYQFIRELKLEEKSANAKREDFAKEANIASQYHKKKAALILSSIFIVLIFYILLLIFVQPVNKTTDDTTGLTLKQVDSILQANRNINEPVAIYNNPNTTLNNSSQKNDGTKSDKPVYKKPNLDSINTAIKKDLLRTSLSDLSLALVELNISATDDNKRTRIPEILATILTNATLINNFVLLEPNESQEFKTLPQWPLKITSAGENPDYLTETSRVNMKVRVIVNGVKERLDNNSIKFK